MSTRVTPDWDRPNALDIALAAEELSDVFGNLVDADAATGNHAAFLRRWGAHWGAHWGASGTPSTTPPGSCAT